jgi:hypothetical protein
MNEPQWTTKTGQKLYCHEMTDSHLANVTRQFIRKAHAQVQRMVSASHVLHGEVAERTIPCNIFDDANFPTTYDILTRQPIWPFMRAECEKRGIDWVVLYEEIAGEL